MPRILGDHARAVAAHINRRGNLERARHRVRNLDKHLQSDAAFRSAKKRSVHELDPVQTYYSGEIRQGLLSPPCSFPFVAAVNSTFRFFSLASPPWAASG